MKNGGTTTVSQNDVAPGGALSAKIPATVAAGSSPFEVAASPDQPPLASFAVSARPGRRGRRPDLVETGKTADFDAAGSTDPDGEIATSAWAFGDGEDATGGSTQAHAYSKPGAYTALLTLTNDEGCSTELVFTSQTAYCNGGAGATATAEVAVEDGLGASC